MFILKTEKEIVTVLTALGIFQQQLNALGRHLQSDACFQSDACLQGDDLVDLLTRILNSEEPPEQDQDKAE